MHLQNTAPTAANLIQQIGKYRAQHTPCCLQAEGFKKLYSGISQYEASHTEKIHSYQTTHGLSEITSDLALNNPLFFRTQFIEYLHQYNPPQYEGDSHQRAIHPETATITMKKLLSPKGLALYHLALEEEMHSKEFRHAVVIQSTSHFDGLKWKQRPVIIYPSPLKVLEYFSEIGYNYRHYEISST